MRKLIFATAGAVALAIGSAASAQVTVTGTSTGLITTPVVGSPTSLSFGYTEAGSDSPFSEWLTFTNALSGIYSITLSTSTTTAGSSTDVDFNPLQVYLTGSTFAGQLFLSPDIDNTDLNEDYFLNTSILGDGTYTLNIGGTRGTAGSFGGNISFAAAAVPEPGTWMMMLLGFGAIGFSVRRSRRLKPLPQLA